MLRNYGKQQCPGDLRKQPMARGEGPLVTLSTCPRPHPRGPGPRPRAGPALLGLRRRGLPTKPTHYHSHPGAKLSSLSLLVDLVEDEKVHFHSVSLTVNRLERAPPPILREDCTRRVAVN
jgi:hypothetical protein